MTFISTKRPTRSLTIIASSVAMGASFLSAFGIHIAPEALGNANDIVAGAAAAVAIYGRIRAKTLIQ